MRFSTRWVAGFCVSLCLSAGALAPPAFTQTKAPDPSIIPKYDKINEARKLLTAGEIETALAGLPGWKAEGGRLTKTFVRKNFVEAIAFINSLVPECEHLDHHPEIFTVYNKVSIALTTYDAGQKISTYDVLLAGRFEALAGPGKAP